MLSATQQEINQMSGADYKLHQTQCIQAELTALTQDIVQYMAGEDVPNIADRKARFIELHNQMRSYLGKQPRGLRNE